MSVSARARLLVLVWLVVAANASPAFAQFAIRGRIATRGLVKRQANGTLEAGPGARPTLVEYDENGYKYDLCNGSCPQLAQATDVIVGSVAQACATQATPDACKAQYASATSVLYRGTEILYASPRVIAYETDFFTIDPSENTGGPSNCVVNEKALPPGTDVNLERMSAFVRCNTPSMNVNGESRVWAPIVGASVEMINFGIYRSTVTNGVGYFEIPYRARTNEYEDFDINAVVSFGGFEPRVASAKKFYLTASAVSGYNYQPGQAYLGLVPLPNYSTDAGSLGTLYANIPFEAAILTVQLQFVGKDGASVSIPVTGYPPDPSAGLSSWPSGITRYSNVKDPNDQIGLLSAISTPDLRDTEIYVYRVADGKLVGSRWGMTNTEVAGSNCGTGVCLVASMLMRGPAPLAVRHSEDRFNPASSIPPVLDKSGNIVTAGKFGIELDYGHGLSGGRIPFLHEGDQAKVIAINRATGYMGTALVKMQHSSTGAMTFVPADGAGLNGILVKLAPPNLKVTVTRETSIPYGSTKTDSKEYIIGFEGSGLTSDKVIKVQTEWFDTDGSALPEDLPGFTGRLAMTAPADRVAGQDGEAIVLPDGGTVQLTTTGDKNSPGGTSSISQPGVDRTGFFPIRAGKTPTVVRLPQGDLDRQHFYVHVDAQPLTRDVDFTGRPGPAGPSFSVQKICYQTCVDEHGDVCAVGAQSGQAAWSCFDQSPDVRKPEGVLSQRPINFVPFQIPKFSESAVVALRRGEKVEPDWFYRPEMQFSLFSLKMSEVDLKNNDDTIRNALNGTTSSYSADSLIKAVYTLQGPTGPALQALDGTRQLGLSLGDKFVNVTFSPQTCGAGQPCPQEQTSVISTPNTLKGLDPRDFLALRLVQKDDQANVLWEYGFQDLWVNLSTMEGKPISQLPRGEHSQATAVLHPTNDELLSKVQWSIDRALTQRDVKIEIDPTTGKIWVPEDSAEGPAVIDARITKDLFAQIRVPVGCDCKTCKVPGQCVKRVGSIDLTFSLGSTQGELTAGQLWVKRDTLDADAYKRKSLQLSIFDHASIDSVGDKDGLRQVIAPETFVEIVDLPAGYEVRFYPPSVKGSGPDESTGLYGVNYPDPARPEVGALAVWRITDPGPAVDAGAAQSGESRMQITEIRDDGATRRQDEYTQDRGSGAWSLVQGGGLRREQRLEQSVAGDRVVRTVIGDNTKTASVVEQTYHTFAWGEELTKEVVDPDGAALTTTTIYYENPDDVGSYRQIYYRIEPSGNWVRYAYDDHRRVVAELHPWLDGPIDPATANASDGRLVQYSYTPVDSLDTANSATVDPSDVGFERPRVVTERILGGLTSLTYRSIRNAPAGGHIELEERCPNASSSFGDGTCLRTETRYRAGDSGDVTAGGVDALIQPDGQMDSYQYERGAWTGSAFAPGPGTALRTTITHGTVANPAGVLNKTTQEVSIVDERGHDVRDEAYAYVDGGYVLISATDRTYDTQGHLTRTTRSNGEEERASWGCCTENSSTDSRGIVTTYVTDDLQRIVSSTRAGVTTTYAYDAEGRQLSVTRSGGGLSLTSTRHYDGAGRLDQSTDEAQLSTTYAYGLGGRISTITHPGGFTEVTEQYLDGQQKSVTGSSVVAQYFTFGLPGDGTRVSEVRTARSDSPAFERMVTDMLGRTLRSERPGFGGSLEVATSSYDASGKLERSTATGSAATLYQYDELGNQTRRGLDVNGNGELDLASVDRITETDTQFASVDGALWQESMQRIYTDASSSTPKVTGVTRARLTGFGGGLVSEQIAIDLPGNITRSTVTINPATATETRTTDVPDSVQDAVTTTINGRLVSSTSTTGLTMTYGYDGLGRRTTQTDPRTGASETHYDDRGRVDYVKDAAGNQTSFGYDDATGRKISETNALGKHSYFAYDARGQLTRTWGDVPYPVKYAYDEYGRRVEMQTYRVEAGWNTPTWPESATGDPTRWHYEEATGLLQSKEDAAGKAVTYAYGPAGRLATRTWARAKSGGGALTTSYAYDPATGELVGVDYNDDTPDVTYAYDRLGRPTTVTDGVGTRVFGYDPATLQLQTETIDGLTPAVLTRYYDPVGVKGRQVGLGLGSSYVVGYGYDPTGRLQSVAWTANGSSDTAIYSRVPGSELLAGYATQSGFATAYGYEPKRDLKTQVANRWNGSVVSQYDYRYDVVGRRTSVENTGSAFGTTKFTSWGYDERNQVTGSHRYTGGFTANPSPANEVATERRGFDYDPIGNRESALDQNGTPSISYAANELNQYDAIGQQAPVYDEDGNLLNDSTKVLAYNAENQLVRVEVPGVSASTFDYDSIGRRVRKSVALLDGSGSDYVVTWVYSGWNKIEERKTVGSTTTVKNFVWGLDLSQSMEGAGGIGGLLAVVDGSGNANLFAYDGNGNVSELVDANGGSMAAHYEYDVFGNLILASGSSASANSYRFSTKYADDETGLVYYGYRYYDSGLGRWTQRDPIGERGGANVYVFVGNDGVLMIDAYGLSWYDGQNAEKLANFLAGAGDTLTMNATSWIRKQMGGDDVIDYGGTSYIAGEVTEVVVETTITVGGSVLRRSALRYAGKAGRAALEGGARGAFRRAFAIAKGGIVHHVNPIRAGRFPLPFKSAARGFWNMTWLPSRAVHLKAHRWLELLDKADYVRTWSQPIRALGNEIMRRLNAEAQRRGGTSVSTLAQDDGNKCLYMPDVQIEQTVSVSSDEIVADAPELTEELR